MRPGRTQAISKIVFVGQGIWTADSREILVANPDGSGVRQLTYNSAKDLSPVIAADGKTVVFVSNRDGDDELYKLDMAAADTEASTVKLTDNLAQDRDPSIGPDGTIYYGSTEAGDLSGRTNDCVLG